MAIVDANGAIAGMAPPQMFSKAVSGTLVAGRPWSSFYAAGIPAAAAAPSPGIGGAALTSYAGQIPIPAASNNTYRGRFSGVSSAQAGVFLLCDRLWHNSGIGVTTTTAQTVTSVTWPARDIAGATSGNGVYIGLEIVTATGAGAATPSISYTNQAGSSGKTSTTIDTYVASSAIGSFYRLGLQAGDTGVQSIQSVTLGVSMTSGSVSLVAYRILDVLEVSAAGVGSAVDFISGGLTRWYDNTVPFVIFIPQTTTTTQISGQVVCTQG